MSRIMTYQEKAYDLYSKIYMEICGVNSDMREPAKECALILINEILDITDDEKATNYKQTKMYWNRVKDEIKNI